MNKTVMAKVIQAFIVPLSLGLIVLFVLMCIFQQWEMDQQVSDAVMTQSAYALGISQFYSETGWVSESFMLYEQASYRALDAGGLDLANELNHDALMVSDAYLERWENQ